MIAVAGSENCGGGGLVALGDGALEGRLQLGDGGAVAVDGRLRHQQLSADSVELG